MAGNEQKMPENYLCAGLRRGKFQLPGELTNLFLQFHVLNQEEESKEN